MSLTSLLASLDVESAHNEHEEVLKIASSVLEKYPNNVQAIKQSLIALISIDNYSKALKIVDTYMSIINENLETFIVELSYIYYKSNQTEKLIGLEDFINKKNIRPYKHILAQYYYKIGENSKSLSIYKDLINENVESESLDLSVNERAVISQLLFENPNSEEVPISKSFNTSYDQLFNEALILILKKDYNNALSLLDKTLSIAKSSFADDYNDENEFDLERFLEITPIVIQISYVYILLSNESKALSILNDIKIPSLNSQYSSNINVQILTLLISNNKLACQDLSGQNASLIIRELNLPNSLSNSLSKLTIPQIDILNRNSNLINKFAGKNNVIYLSNEEKSLLKVQNDISKKNIQAAITRLSDCSIIYPSIGKLLYTLYSKLDCKNLINKLLLEVYELLMEKEEFTQDEISYATFISLKLMSTNEESSKNLLNKVNNVGILSKAFTQQDVDSLIQNVDINSLVKSGITPLISNSVSSNITNTIKSNTSKRRIRSKPKRLPKNVNSSIDNERWLPMKDRSYYKSKKSKKGKITQGGFIDEKTEKSLDINSKTETVSATSTSSKNKKKKKGKK